MPGDCGSARPTRVEPRLHCVGIAWQVRGKCADSAAHSPLRAITARALSAARAIEPRPTHSARVPRTWRSTHSRAFCGPRKVRLAHCDSSIQIQGFHFKKIYLEMSSVKWGPFGSDLDLLTISQHWFKQWPGAKQRANHYLKQQWSGLLMHT